MHHVCALLRYNVSSPRCGLHGSTARLKGKEKEGESDTERAKDRKGTGGGVGREGGVKRSTT